MRSTFRFAYQSCPSLSHGIALALPSLERSARIALIAPRGDHRRSHFFGAEQPHDTTPQILKAPSNGVTTHDVKVPIITDADVDRARQLGRQLAAELPFSESDITVIVTAIAELARNLYVYAKEGVMRIAVIDEENRKGVRVVAHDSGPGMKDTTRALEEGYSTSGRDGLGLAGVRRLVDQFEITSQVGVGTEVIVHKWVHPW